MAPISQDSPLSSSLSLRSIPVPSRVEDHSNGHDLDISKCSLCPAPQPARALLESLLVARGPCGLEHEVRTLVAASLRSSCDSVTVDAAGNVIGCIRAPCPSQESPICLLAHMDELSMIVKRIEPDGSLVVRPLGGIEPANFGQGPVDILADTPLAGALTFGAMHVSMESKSWEIKGIGGNQPVSWDHVRVETRTPFEVLASHGVRPGTRVVIGRGRRSLTEVGDCFAAHFMDNRAPLTSMLLAASALQADRSQLGRDVYFIATTCEEHVGTPGATHAIREHPHARVVALDVVPVAEEYDVRLSADPVIIAADKETLYAQAVIDALLQSSHALGFHAHTAVLENYRSDASELRRLGLSPEIGLVGIPTIGTHGFEVIHREAIERLTRLLTHFMLSTT